MCEAPVIQNGEAKAALFERTQLVYVRPDTPNVPDNDPQTVQFMIMAADDDRPSHVSSDGQVIYLRPETRKEYCRDTFVKLLDQSYDIRLLIERDGA